MPGDNEPSPEKQRSQYVPTRNTSDRRVTCARVERSAADLRLAKQVQHFLVEKVGLLRAEALLEFGLTERVSGGVAKVDRGQVAQQIGVSEPCREGGTCRKILKYQRDIIAVRDRYLAIIPKPSYTGLLHPEVVKDNKIHLCD